jgi:hypothetical protein
VVAKIDADAVTMFAADEADGSTTVYFETQACKGSDQGIYRITDADTAS